MEVYNYLCVDYQSGGTTPAASRSTEVWVREEMEDTKRILIGVLGYMHLQWEWMYR